MIIGLSIENESTIEESALTNTQIPSTGSFQKLYEFIVPTTEMIENEDDLEREKIDVDSSPSSLEESSDDESLFINDATLAPSTSGNITNRMIVSSLFRYRKHRFGFLRTWESFFKSFSDHNQSYNLAYSLSLVPTTSMVLSSILNVEQQVYRVNSSAYVTAI